MATEPRTGFVRVPPHRPEPPEPEPVARDDEPTDEQLENVCHALGMPVLPLALRPLFWRQSMLNLHGIVQRSINGDEQASLVLDRLMTAFSHNRRDASVGAGADTRKETT